MNAFGPSAPDLGEGIESNEEDDAAVKAGLLDAFMAYEDVGSRSPSPGASYVSAVVQSVVAMGLQRYPGDGDAVLMGAADGVGRAIAAHQQIPQEAADLLAHATAAVTRGHASMAKHILEGLADG